MTYYQRTYNKYGAKKQEYNGRKYDSKLEATYAEELDLALKAGEIKEVIPQFKISIDVNGYHICNHYVDFKIINKDDSVELHEVKGVETDIYRMKRKLLEATYLLENPDIKYLILKQSNSYYFSRRKR